MRTYQFDKPVSIINLGDIHRGNNNCDTDLLKKNIQIIADNPHIYWVSTGDMLETAIKVASHPATKHPLPKKN